MRIAILCEDALTGDGLHCLLATLPGCQIVASGKAWAGLEGPLRRSSISVLLVLGEISDKDQLSIARAQRQKAFRVVSDSVHSQLDLHVLISRSEGFAGIKRALSGMGTGPTVHESASTYGGRHELTPREREVARLVSQGMPNRRIATVLGIQEQSVKNLVSVVMRKLRCENRVQLALHLSSSRH